MAGNVGILALQGDFDSHREALERLGVATSLVKTTSDLTNLRGLVLPGGESTTLLKLMDEEFRSALRSVVNGGLPTLATCAGLILLARSVTNPKQESLNCLDVDIERNAYGRQVDSFIDPQLELTAQGKELEQRLPKANTTTLSLEGVFIRAPRITRIGTAVSPLLLQDRNIVLVQQGNIMGATFHPELSPGISLAHAFFQSLLS